MFASQVVLEQNAPSLPLQVGQLVVRRSGGQVLVLVVHRVVDRRSDGTATGEHAPYDQRERINGGHAGYQTADCYGVAKVGERLHEIAPLPEFGGRLLVLVLVCHDGLQDFCYCLFLQIDSVFHVFDVFIFVYIPIYENKFENKKNI